MELAGETTVAEKQASDTPPIDPAELAARLRLTVMRLARRLRSQTVAGLSPSLISALVSIEVRGSVTPGELAALERVKPPTVTRMVASLERAGLVRRQPDSADRRVARLLRDLDAADLQTLRQVLPVLERLLEADT
jgi:DNA-binding MarR family transcriptional regulator